MDKINMKSVLFSIGILAKNGNILKHCGLPDFAIPPDFVTRVDFETQSTASVQQIEIIPAPQPQFCYVETEITLQGSDDPEFEEAISHIKMDIVDQALPCKQGTITNVRLPATIDSPDPAIPWEIVMHSAESFWSACSDFPVPFMEKLIAIGKTSPVLDIKADAPLYNCLKGHTSELVQLAIRVYYAITMDKLAVTLRAFPPTVQMRPTEIPTIHQSLPACHFVQQAIFDLPFRRQLTDLGDFIAYRTANRAVKSIIGKENTALRGFLVSNKVMAALSCHLHLRSLIETPTSSLNKGDADLFEAYIGASYLVTPDKIERAMYQMYCRFCMLIVDYKSSLHDKAVINTLCFIYLGYRPKNSLGKAFSWWRNEEERISHINNCARYSSVKF